jgi:hypothetical protein
MISDKELDALVARLRPLSIAVMADRLYILGSDQFADYELVARWSAEVTPGTVLQLLNAITALRQSEAAFIANVDEHLKEVTRLRADLAAERKLLNDAMTSRATLKAELAAAQELVGDIFTGYQSGSIMSYPHGCSIQLHYATNDDAERAGNVLFDRIDAFLAQRDPAASKDHDLARQATEPTQKPVAWQWLNTGHFRKKIPANSNACEWRPLYAPSDPPQTPMTEEQIAVAWALATSTEPKQSRFIPTYLAFARAVERHHGIGPARGE